MFCFKCGSEIKDGEKFCSNCGQAVTKNFAERKANNVTIRKKKSLPIFLGWILTVIGGFFTWYTYDYYSHYVNNGLTWAWSSGWDWEVVSYEEVQNTKMILTGSTIVLIVGIILLIAGYYLKVNSNNERSN